MLSNFFAHFAAFGAFRAIFASEWALIRSFEKFVVFCDGLILSGIFFIDMEVVNLYRDKKSLGKIIKYY